MFKVHCGDNIEILKSMPDNSVDSVVTDPPYGLGKEPDPMQVMRAWVEKGVYEINGKGFMGKEWDKFVPQPIFWREVYRVLKPGGHVVSFFGSRTYDWGVMAMRFAGFEIRDQIMWVYGAGFPKSLNISKEMDKRRFGSGDIAAFKESLCEAVIASGKSRKQIDEECGFTMRFDTPYEKDPAGWGCSLPSPEKYSVICDVLGVKFDDELCKLREFPRVMLEKLYKVVGHEKRLNAPSGIVGAGRDSVYVDREITAPSTPAAKQWEGFGTALKPAHEPIVLARKPLDGTVAGNVLKHGCGGLNIDGCRVDTQENLNGGAYSEESNRKKMTGDDREGVALGMFQPGKNTGKEFEQPQGRFPANFIHDGSEEVVGLFPESKSTGGSGEKSMGALGKSKYGKYALDRHGSNAGGLGDSGSAARFFYCAKASKKDRDEGCEKLGLQKAGALNLRTDSHSERNGMDTTPRRNHHPTVKPTDLMCYLSRLVTPPGGTILDPFMGSGSTGKAAMREGFKFVGIELDSEYVRIAKARIKHEYGKYYKTINIKENKIENMQKKAKKVEHKTIKYVQQSLLDVINA